MLRLLLRRAKVSARRRGFVSSAGEDDFQTSLAQAVSRRGIGLHSGKETCVTLFPSEAGNGRYFTLENVHVPAGSEFVVASQLCTSVGRNGVNVSTVEHLLAALETLRVDNCWILLEGNNEVPLLDGSALDWVKAIDEAGIVIAKDENGSFVPRLRYKLKQPVCVTKGDSFVAAFPAPSSRITCGIDFPEHPAIGNQWFSWSPDAATFRNQVAPARTFAIYEQIESLRAAGLIKGGCLENALVCSKKDGWLNPPLRFSDEPCRHKLLDFLGDISLCSQDGNPGLPTAHIIAYKASHALNSSFCKALLQAMQNQEQQSDDSDVQGSGF